MGHGVLRIRILGGWGVGAGAGGGHCMFVLTLFLAKRAEELNIRCDWNRDNSPPYA